MSKSTEKKFEPVCPLPISDYPQVLLAHGGGGSLMNSLIEKMFFEAFGNQTVEDRHDSAVLNIPKEKIAFTTDSYVVSPLFFPGGDIGSLAINGTVNDLAMSGARPLYISSAFILEEGLEMETLWRVVCSMSAAAKQAGVGVVTGDTKVVDRGKGDGIFINTSGVGLIEHDLLIAPSSVQAGDVVLLSGDIGRHGMTIMCAREGLSIESSIESDCAEVSSSVDRLLKNNIQVHCMRDLTRGGLASALIEIAQSNAHSIVIEETQIPVEAGVQGACEILGLDPLYVANEGRFVVFVPEADAGKALELLRKSNEPACIIGEVRAEKGGELLMKSCVGTTRLIDMISGEQLPRIC